MTTITETKDEAQQAWITDAVRILKAYGDGHPLDVFTTKEVWPLLDNPPGDRRGLGVAVTRAIKEGHIRRAYLVPDPGEATTKDGVTFPFNKPLWAYRSTLLDINRRITV